MTTPQEPNPIPGPEAPETIDEVWLDGFQAGMDHAFGQVLDLCAARRLSPEELRGVASPVPEAPSASPKFPYLVPTLSGFYGIDFEREANAGRFLSGEADYGVHWRLKGWPGRWRVSYIQSTGEVYAVHDRQCVLVLGIVPADTPVPGEIYYHTLDRVLDGWAEHCGRPNGLSWAIARLREWREEVDGRWEEGLS